MINVNNLREVENVSSARKINKGGERTVLRNKTPALGDVQNTIHFRSTNSSKPTNNSAKKGSTKLPDFQKSIAKENALSVKKPKPGRKNVIANDEPVHSTSQLDADMLDVHNHFLCEQATQDSVSDFLLQYKFTEKEIDNLVKSVKSVRKPLNTPVIASYPDIEIPNFEEIFPADDIFSDLVLPAVPAPVDF